MAAGRGFRIIRYINTAITIPRRSKLIFESLERGPRHQALPPWQHQGKRMRMDTPDVSPPIEILERSRGVWNREARNGCRWSIPVDKATIAARGPATGSGSPRRTFRCHETGLVKCAGAMCSASRRGGEQQSARSGRGGARVTSFDLRRANWPRGSIRHSGRAADHLHSRQHG